MTRKQWSFGLKRTASSVLAVLLCMKMNFAQQSPERQRAAEAEHQREMHALGLTTMRPGVSTASLAANPVNYDEAKAKLSSPLPDPLLFNNGDRVRTLNDWAMRRAEIVAVFDNNIFGRVPPHVPAVVWSVVGTESGAQDFTETQGIFRHIPFVTKHLVGHVDNSADPEINVNLVMDLTLPQEHKGRVPVELDFSWDFQKPKGTVLPRATSSGPNWRQQVLARGWGYAELNPLSIQGDSAADLQDGIIGLTNHGRRRDLDQWGALRAWAWGASRTMDYLETNDSVDFARVGVDGHSRYGKAALVTMAYDTRFRVAYISSAGAGGTALWRRNFGEQIENVAAVGEFHWMAGNFLKYSADPMHASDLPVDMNELIALCAPRAVFVGAGTTQGDGWADAKGEFLAELGATPVYHLFGEQGIESDQFPPQGEAIISGSLGFRQHEGGHTQAPNWPVYLQFAEKAFR